MTLRKSLLIFITPGGTIYSAILIQAYILGLIQWPVLFYIYNKNIQVSTPVLRIFV
ncbi:hypothetical protein LX64_00525 [Chitinophaga skermanii]|uniref:Uncharacterized protein n=1 Tax=Chitinophaga skermanii TaxID=331697 RepID=A0A327R4D3_9BACT|nr:hypothetical protein LX64_00525 [Chitinophaga skermanii]